MAKTQTPPAPARPAPKPAHDDPGPTTPPPEAPPPRMPERHEPPPSHEHEREVAGPRKVRAIRDGYYGEKYRRAGDVFTLERGDRLGKWMEEVDPDTPERLTSHGEALQAQREDVMTQRAIERGRAPGVQAPIDNPDDGRDPIGAREG